MSFATFNLVLRPRLADSEVTVNGETVDNVRALRLDHTDREFPTLSLVLDREGVLEGDGVVQVSNGQTQADAVLTFLDGLDPDQLERDALEGVGMGEATTGQLFLNALRKYATPGS